MKPITTTDMLAALDKGRYFYENRQMADLREVDERIRNLEAMKQIRLIIKMVRDFGGIDEVLSLLKNTKQPSLFPPSDVIPNNLEDLSFPDNIAFASQTTP